MKILLGVTGSIAAYKSYDLCRELTKIGHEVKVILTRGGENFIKKETFTYLGASEVYSASDDFNTDKYKNFTVLHVELSKWADKFIIAPCSAHKISELSYGFANDLLSTTFLAFTKDVLIFPAMNTEMLNNQLIQKNIQRLSELNHVYIHGTKSGLLACGDEGAGKLEDIDIIKDLILYYTKKRTKKNILITTGATIAPIDPVRYVTNPSSGLTGLELALKYYSKGHNVTLIIGHNPHPELTKLKRFPSINIIQVKTTKEMFEKVKELFNDIDTYISSAAISDIEFTQSESKIKKDQLNSLPQATQAPDILKYAIENKKQQKIVGFAAETEDLDQRVYAKLKRKPVDLMIGNLVSNGATKAQQGFSQIENQYSFYNENEKILEKHLTKKELAENIYNFIEKNESI
jgi:phosphopantothenoylcysteine decarboxylase/phosphopantothenate--cysteine ligase